MNLALEYLTLEHLTPEHVTQKTDDRQTRYNKPTWHAMTEATPTNLVEHDIQPEDTLAFIHVPKAGGVTLGALIDPMWLPGARCPVYMTLPLARFSREQIASYRSFIGHFNYSALAQLLPGKFKCITMLRHPFSRQLSFLRMLKRLGESAAEGTTPPVLEQIGNPFFRQIFEQANLEGSEHTLHAWREKPLEVLVEDEDLQKKFGLLNGQVLQLTPLRPVAGRLPDQPGLSQGEVEQMLLESARDNLANMLGFGLQECFQDSLYLLSFLFGWRPLPDALRMNEAPHPLVHGNLPPGVLDRLEKYNELDLQLYDHASALFEQRFRMMTDTLLERYGNRQQVRLTRPLPADVMDELLDKHYRSRLQSKNPAGYTGTSSTFTFDQAVSAALGWHRREISPGQGSFRWTGPGRQSSIDLFPLPGGDIQLQLVICNAVKPGLVDDIIISIHGEMLPCASSSTEGETLLQCVIPRSLVMHAPYLRIGILVPETISPHSLDSSNPDIRQLGVAVNRINQEIIHQEENS